ncbi:hypothetical protein PVK06_007405 [Gossypium arboreum]|uniref:Reverse transcriptase domain-containing protein n=1 Tax=Gossypium arboreum TaxID=29729 RepID=A0ABR0QHI5_GOSAR|nr:hypothetical protein PVK06_007405 [Gossypium arboreum]
MDQSTSRRLIKLDMEVRDELENVLNHEELLWRQKQNARCDWLQFGDRNTSFFHSRTLQRRKTNRIMSLRISSGEWSAGQSVLSDEATIFFERLYGETPSPMPNHPENIFPSLKENEIDYLSKPVLNDEIKKALFDMAPLKDFGKQVGFIAGRSISDNIIIAQEVIHSMRSRKDDRKWMAIKLDLEKAYDRISWEFIDASL